MKIRLADYIMKRLTDHGIRDAFLVTGGGAMHLNDAIGRAPGLKWTAFHHEQACAMAAESYYRLTNRLALVNVTSGPGGINALNGVFGAFTDSLSMVVVSGQVKRETTTRFTKSKVRQLGDQEVDIVALAAPLTKYAAMVEDPADIRLHLDRALRLATSGRPGPVWIDVPIDVQAALIEPDELAGDDAPSEPERPPDPALVDEVVSRLKSAKRPVILAGAGVRIAGAAEPFERLASRLRIPVATAFNAHDLLPHDHAVLAGRPGTIGERAGNFAVQGADFVLVLGCRLNIRQISYNWGSFARNAFLAMVDVDEAEFQKPTLRIDLPIHADARLFLAALSEAVDASGVNGGRHEGWLSRCKERREKYPVVLPEYREKDAPINPYVFVEQLFEALEPGDIVVTGDGTACVVTFQAARLKAGQRLYSNSGSASMGYDLPAAIGAAIGAGGKRVICLAGDGSLQMNVQELATVTANRLPVKVFLLNNLGYHSIRQTQQAYFPDNVFAVGPGTGLTFPDYALLARAFGLDYVRAGEVATLRERILEALASPGGVLCEVVLDPTQPFSPKLASRRLPDGTMVSPALEDMAPFLPREELQENMATGDEDDAGGAA